MGSGQLLLRCADLTGLWRGDNPRTSYSPYTSRLSVLRQAKKSSLHLSDVTRALTHTTGS